ncbi:MAG: DUF2723 domain-containing protein [Muribaculaceae bacterium]|nr:DUF2723 domain-containing protein [Muribaculaceae bacterium]
MILTEKYILERTYRKLSFWIGMVVLAVGLLTYMLTLEPTASYWDCPEYIAVATGMQPGHPPGNPVWMLAARFFINFSPAPQYDALAVNILSGVCSALTVWILYLTILWMARRLIIREERITADKALISIGAAGAGALVFCWSDTFWFSAVEAEVYAFSSLCTALLFRLALVWYDRRREPHSDRWLILIAYLTGLSLGVHELNLLCLPAIAAVVIFGLYPRPGAARLTAGILLSLGAVALVLYGLIPGFMALAKAMELWCVNGAGLPFNSGLLLAWILVMGFLIAGAIRLPGCGLSPRLARAVSVCLWSAAMLLLGFSSYAVIIIRANANPPLNTGNPSDIFAFANYFSREQYGKSPLLYGAPFTAEPLRERSWTTDSAGSRQPQFSRYRLTGHKAVYTRGAAAMPPTPRSQFATKEDSAENARLQRRGGDRYLIKEYTFRLAYQPELDMVLPRMHSHASDDVEGYYNWLGATEDDMYHPDSVTRAVDSLGNPVSVPGAEKWAAKPAFRPTYLQNLQYLTVYQCGFMYWRYFLWNFAGRQNDVSGHGEPDAGNFVTGIAPLDRAMLDNTSGAPAPDGRDNPGHNVYYFLPLLLGILGIAAQMRAGHEGRRQALAVTMLFLLTGIAIVLYLNQGPVQARDRDYAFAGSFYAFAIWAGLGAIPLCHWMQRLIRRPLAGAAAGTLLSLAVPLQMLSQTADDHDRSGRTATPDMARDMLAAMSRDAIFFATDDNSIFPAWYMQETEGYRTDIRAISTPYLNSAWYHSQLVSHMRESSPIPLTLPREMLPLLRSPYISLRDSDLNWTPALPALRRLYTSLPDVRHDAYPVISTPRLFFTLGADTVFIDLRKADSGSLSRFCNIGSLLTVDMLATSAASPRPRDFYWTVSGGMLALGGQLKDKMEQIGNVSRLNPANPGLNADATGHLALDSYRYGGAGNPSRPYFDPVAAHQVSLLRRAILQSALILSERDNRHDALTARRLLEKCEAEMPARTVPYEGFYDYDRNHYTDEGLITAETWQRIGATLSDPSLSAKGDRLLAGRRDYLRCLAAFRDAMRPAYRPYITTRVDQQIQALPLADSLLQSAN